LQLRLVAAKESQKMVLDVWIRFDTKLGSMESSDIAAQHNVTHMTV